MFGEIKVHPELCRWAIAHHSADKLRLWYILRWRYSREGRVPLAEAEAWAVEWFEYSSASFRKTIKDGDGEWWRVNPLKNEAWLVGLEKICTGHDVALTIITAGIPFDAFKHTTTFKAYSFSTFFVGKKETIFSRALLAKLFKTSESTLHRWEKIAGIEAQTMICLVPVPSITRAVQMPLNLDNRASHTHWYQCRYCKPEAPGSGFSRHRFKEGLYQHIKAYHPEHRHEPLHKLCWIGWRLPNRYVSNLERLAPGSAAPLYRSHYKHPDFKAQAPVRDGPAYTDTNKAAHTARLTHSEVYQMRKTGPRAGTFNYHPGKILADRIMGTRAITGYQKL